MPDPNKKPAIENLIWKNLKSENPKNTDNNLVWLPKKDDLPSNKVGFIMNKPSSNIGETPSTKNIKIRIFISKEGKLKIKPSNKIISTILSKLESSSYNIKENEWVLDLKFYEKLLVDFGKNKIVFEKIPNGTLCAARKEYSCDTSNIFDSCSGIPNSNALSAAGNTSKEDNIYEMLMHFQKQAVSFAINKGGRILLGDDMGLGKTIQALAIAYFYRLEFPLLIIAPSSLCFNWYESVSRFLNLESSIIRERLDFAYNSRVHIISYNLAVSFIDSLLNIKHNVIICDECHYLKSNTSKRTKVILPLLQKASRLIMVSGTPATSRPVELYPILSALDKSLFPSFQAYGNRYCDGRKIRGYYDYKGCTNAEELGYILERCYMIRRTKDVVMEELPLKSRRKIVLSCGEASRKRIPGEEGVELDESLMGEYTLAASIKKPFVLKYLEEFVEKGVKCIVFAHHKEMLDALEGLCIEKKLKYIRIDGTTPVHKRNMYVQNYQEDGTIVVAVLSLTACCTGLTLTAGKAVIFAELYWNPGTMLQAEDRIHRIGQKDNIDIHYLVCTGTIDEVVWPKLIKKLGVLESLGVGKQELKMVGAENNLKNLFKRV